MKWYILILIILLFPSLVIATADIYENDNNYADANYILTNSSKQEHNFHNSSDIDFVKFNVTAGSQYIIETFNKTAIDITDTELTLYNFDGTTQLDYNDDIESGILRTSRLVFNPSANETYYIKVTEYYQRSEGIYDISVTEIGRLIPSLIYPSTNLDITKGLFNFTINIKCVNGQCFDIKAYLDPKENKEKDFESKIEKNVISGFADSEKVDIIVMLKDDKKEKTRSSYSIHAEKSLENKMKGFEKKRSYSTISGFAGKINAKDLYVLSSDENVEAVYLDRPVMAHLASSVPLIRADDVWPMQVNGINITGNDETICIIDTGINYQHSDFGSCSPTDNINDGSCAKVIGGYDFVNNDENPIDDQGHGSHVAGIATSQDPTYQGVAPGAKIVAIKVLDNAGNGVTSNVIAGIDWCIANSSKLNISVISLSLGESGSKHDFHCIYAAEKTSVDTATSNGINVVISAGNEDYTDGISTPACIENATSVGNINDAGSFTDNRGNILDLVAPGVSITATDYDGTHVTYSGTSMSAPHVSGTIALMKQYFKLKYNRTLKPDEVKHNLKYNGDWLYDSGSKNYFPRINAFNSVNAKGIIPTTVGAKPFYSLTPNPHNESCLSLLNDGESCNITWIVEATGDENNTYEFFVIFEMDYRQNWSDKVNITIAYSVNLISPTNNLYTSQNSLNFNCSSFYNNGLNNISLYGNFNGTWLLNSSNEVSGTSNISNWTLNIGEGNYLWNCKVCDAWNNCNFAQQNYSFKIDNTKPGFESLNYSNIIELGSSQYITINITENRINYVNISYLGLNQTMYNYSNIYFFNFTPRLIGQIDFTIYALDIVDNLNSTNASFIVNDSTDKPLIKSITELEETLHQNEMQIITTLIYDKEPLTVNLNFNGSNVTMINVSSYNFTYSWNVMQCGLVDYYIYANNSNFSNNANGSFTIDLCCGNNLCETGESCSSCANDCGTCPTTTSSGGGSGGGKTVTPKDVTSFVIAKTSPSNPINLEIKNEYLPINSLKIEVNKEINQAKVKVSGVNNLPEGINEYNKKVYKYLEITTEKITDADIKNAKVEFMVDNDWLANNNIQRDRIAFFRYKDGWTEQKTEYLMTINNKHYFSAEVSGFSIFAIAEKPNEIVKEKPVEANNETSITGAAILKEEVPKEEFWNKKFTIKLFLIITLIYISSIAHFIVNKRKIKL